MNFYKINSNYQNNNNIVSWSSCNTAQRKPTIGQIKLNNIFLTSYNNTNTKRYMLCFVRMILLLC